MPFVMFSTMVGKESLESCSSKVFVYHQPKGQSQRHLTEQTLNRLVQDASNAALCRKVGVPVVTPSVIGVRAEIGGDFTQQSYELAEGEVVKVFVSKKEAWNKLPVTACALIQMRDNAPLHRLSAKLLTSPKTRYKNADFVGRFDLISMEDALNKGVTISPQFRHLFKDSVRDIAFALAILEPEKAPAPAVASVSVQTAAGPRVVVIRDRRRSLEM